MAMEERYNQDKARLASISERLDDALRRLNEDEKRMEEYYGGENK